MRFPWLTKERVNASEDVDLNEEIDVSNHTRTEIRDIVVELRRLTNRMELLAEQGEKRNASAGE